MKNSKENLITLAEYLVEFGRKKGADEIEVSILQENEFNVHIRMKEIESLVEAHSKKLQIRIIKDKKIAVSTSEDFSQEILENLISTTLERAKISNPDDFIGLPEKQELKVDLDSLNIYDSKILELSPEEKINFAVQIERIALMDKRISNSHGVTFGTKEIERILVNSKGFEGQYSETVFSISIGLQAEKKGEKVDGFWYCAKRHFGELDKPEEIAREAVRRTVRQLGARKVKTQNVPIILEPIITAELLSFLFTCVSGISIYRKSSFLVDKLGEKIANDSINVIDNGLMRGKLGTRPFDNEGMLTRKTYAIKRGILENYLCNSYSARKLNLKSTGNCTGRGVGPNNFYLVPGKKSQEEIIKSVDKGLLVTRTIGHGFNPVTGDISRGAFGLWIEKGEIAYPVSEITISGNLGRILKDISIIGNDIDFRSHYAGPTIKIEEMTVGGI